VKVDATITTDGASMNDDGAGADRLTSIATQLRGRPSLLTSTARSRRPAQGSYSNL